MPRATSMNPMTTFTEFSHPPLFGSFFSTEGKRAKRVNGSAKAIEKASIVTIGVQNSPEVDLMRTEPTIGPVQENDTSTSVRARKKIPPSPLVSAFESLLFTIHEGMVISNAPKNEAAKTMNTRKKMTLGSQCVASQLKMSAVTASPPTMRVMRMIAAMGTV